MCLPLFGSPYLIYLFYKHRKTNFEQYKKVAKNPAVNDVGEELSGSINAVVDLVFAPYRQVHMFLLLMGISQCMI